MYTMPERRKNKRPITGCISGLLVLLLVVGGLGFVLVRMHNGTAIAVGNDPTVIVHNCDEPIVVRTGQAHQIVLPGVFPQYRQSTSMDAIEVVNCDSIANFNQVTLTVPPQTNLQLDSTNNAITLFGVSGQMNLSANGARITLVNVTLEGQSKIDDNGGVVTLMGDLAQGSKSSISENSGMIDMTLPASLAFHLDATGIVGPIVSDYAAVQEPADLTSDIHVDVGHANSGVTLSLGMNDTALILHKGT